MATKPARNQRGRVSTALDELQNIIKGRYPSASFQRAWGDDPPGTYLIAALPFEDRDQVIDLFIDRLLDMQTEEGLPVYVMLRRASMTAASPSDRVDASSA